MSSLPGNPENQLPTIVSSGTAFVALVGACLAGSTGPIQTVPLLLEAVGLTLFISGVLLRRRNHRLIGRILTGIGFVGAVLALSGFIILAPPLSILLVCLSCGIGLLVVTLGVFLVEARLAHSVAIVGIALTFSGIIGTTIVNTPPFWRLAIAVGGVFLSWDTADQAIRLGEQVGGTAETISVEITRITTSTVVAFIAVIVTIAISQISISSNSIVGLALLLVAILLFILALSHFPQQPDPHEGT